MTKQIKYLALTTGPINKTLQGVKSTKAIWAASYLFSWLVREILKDFRQGRNVLMPAVRDPDYYLGGKGVGLVPDRFIILAGDNDFDELEAGKEAVLKVFSEKMADDLVNPRHSKNHQRAAYQAKDLDATLLRDFLRPYFKLYSLEIELSESDNPMEAVHQYLDYLELEETFPQQETQAWFKDFFERMYYNFLVYDGFPDLKQGGRFPSTVEIATAPLRLIDESKYETAWRTANAGEGDDSDKSQENFLEELAKQFREDIRFRHKYIAVVRADGDNMGEFNKQLFKQAGLEIGNRFEHFDEQMKQFSLDAVKLVRSFGGLPIYVGGDDLLFFAPVGNGESFEAPTELLPKLSEKKEDGTVRKEPPVKSVFWLIDKIDALYKHYILEDTVLKPLVGQCQANKKPSLSFGLSISYYKFPLNEALAEGMDLLFNKAKKEGNKDAVSYAVIKHSGNGFGSTFSKKSPAYEKFREMLLHIPKATDANFISSVMYKLEPQKVVLEDAAKNEDSLCQFFENNFNEKGHLSHKNGFLKYVRVLIYEIFKEPLELDEKIAKVYAALRFIQFLISLH